MELFIRPLKSVLLPQHLCAVCGLIFKPSEGCIYQETFKEKLLFAGTVSSIQIVWHKIKSNVCGL